ncbi:MAG: hypothetical protein ACFCVK_13315 [Acidimicrobiales bacterium]
MAEAPADLMLASLRGDAYPLRDWLTSYPLLLVALDPYTHESAWILETAARFLHHYSPSDIRVGWIATTDDDGCRQFLGPWSERFLTFPDPDRELVVALGLERLPGLIHVRADGWVDVANGWDPERWRTIAGFLSKILRWTRPTIPRPGDPTPYVGTPVKGT